MSIEWKLVENPTDGDVLTYVGVYVTCWKPEWGKPTVGFVETEKIESTKPTRPTPALSPAEIAKQIREWAEKIHCSDVAVYDAMRAFADRIEAEAQMGKADGEKEA
jgi:hypothetical protein